MSRDLAQKTDPVESVADLAAWFAAGCKGDGALGIGTEHEKPGYQLGSLAPLAYDGPAGIGALLQALAERHGWTPALDGGRILALERDGAAVTLEPGGQLELSGRVTRSLDETRDELAAHLREVAAIGAELGQRWTHLALQPWNDLDAVPWMPKSRYRLMREYLPTRGSLAHWMMKMTCTTQANLDYRDERDAIDLIGTVARVSPLVTALFANSPARLGRLTGDATFRMRVWEETDPDRCGSPDVLFDDAATFADHAEWALDVPMFFVRRDGQYLDPGGRTFRTFLAEGYDGTPATVGDWELHISTVFPDVRLKHYVETRTTDAGPPPWILAVPAIWKGIGYSSAAREAARLVVDVESGHEGRLLAAIAAREGLDGTWKGQTLRARAAGLVDVAGAGLDAQRCASERRYLSVLLDEHGVARAPGEHLARRFAALDGDRDLLTAEFSVDAWLDSLGG